MLKRLLAPLLATTLALALFACAPSPKTAGNISMSLRDYEQAVTEYQKALKSDPNSVVLLTGLGRAYYKLGRYEEAKETFTAAVQVHEGYPEAVFYLGLSTIATGDRDRGFAILRDFRYVGKPELTNSVRTMVDLLSINEDADLEYIQTRLFKAWSDGQLAEQEANKLN